MNVFDEINKNDNLIFSHLHIYDLHDLIKLINDYTLVYRNKLSVNTKTSFGLEIEFINPNKEIIHCGDWSYKSELSIDTNGYELSSPIFHNNLKDWLEIKNVCNFVKDHMLYTPESGGHIHIGSSTFQAKYQYWYNFLALYAAYEEIIYRFAFGEYLNGRKGIVEYAQNCKSHFIYYLNKVKYQDIINKHLYYSESIFGNMQQNRNHALNLTNVKDTCRNTNKNTLEFRVINGTFEEIIWQNNINLILNMVKYAKSDNFDINLIKNRFNNVEYSEYAKIHFDKAIEFCDLIFNNNLDKVYFLRQYLKNMKSTHKTAILVKADKFI